MKAVLQSIFFSVLINILYIFGELAIGYIQTVLYQPDLSEIGDVYVLQQSVAFGSTGNFLAALSIRTGIGALLIYIILRIFAKMRAVHS